MFGVDFSELALVFVVALVVLGPTRLPGLVRKVGLWVGRARSMARQFREQLETEVNLEELNRMTQERPKPAQQPTYPPPPPEFGGEPADAADATQSPVAGQPAGAAQDAGAAEPPAVADVYTPEHAAHSPAEPEYTVPPPDDPSHNDLSQESPHGRSG